MSPRNLNTASSNEANLESLQELRLRLLPTPPVLTGKESKEFYHEWKFRMKARLDTLSFLSEREKIQYIAIRTTQGAFGVLRDRDSLPGTRYGLSSDPGRYQNIDDVFRTLDSAFDGTSPGLANLLTLRVFAGVALALSEN